MKEQNMSVTLRIAKNIGAFSVSVTIFSIRNTNFGDMRKRS
jgi:hypothetical protein